MRRLGPALEVHPRFPNRTNVQIARAVDRSTLEIQIWERGAGFTLASGSSSCAVAAAARKKGLVDAEVEVRMPGGTLGIRIADDWELRMRGAVEEIGPGEVLDSYIARAAGTV